MIEARSHAACAVFEGNVIVAGGWCNEGRDTDSVESYDVIGDEWSPMANMVECKMDHSLVVVKDKLYVIGYLYPCEIFDNYCKKFVVLKMPTEQEYFFLLYYRQTLLIGQKIYFFEDEDGSAIYYDVDKGDCSYELCDVTKDLRHYACVTVPWL